MNLALRQRLKDNFRGDSGGSALANLNSAIEGTTGKQLRTAVSSQIGLIQLELEISSIQFEKTQEA
jgi:hypothetical protein